MVHFLSLVLLAIGLAIPTIAQNLEKFQLHLPNGQSGSTLAPTKGLKLVFLTFGVGHQNYTCTAGFKGAPSSWTSIGAVADLRDLSKDTSAAAHITNDLMKGGKSGSSAPDLATYPLIGRHFFNTASGKLVPTFVINEKKITVTKIGKAPSPLKPERNVDWLQLSVTSGSFAKSVYRTTTRGGRPPTGACKVGTTVQEKYAAIYSFWV